MNKEIKYQDIIKTQSLLRGMYLHQEEEVYQTLKDYLKRADDFIQDDILTDKEKESMSSIEVATLLQKNVLVRVQGAWYQVKICMPKMKLLILDRRLPEVENDLAGDRVFIWEVDTIVIGQE